MGRIGNTFGSQSVSLSGARKVWREVKDQYPAGGVVQNVSDWYDSSSDENKIPAGTFCKWEDAGTDGGKQVTCYTTAQITAADDVTTLGINGATLYDIDLDSSSDIATATVVYAGEYYNYMVDDDVLTLVDGLTSIIQIKFIS